MKYVELKDIHLSNVLCFKSMSRHPKISIVFSVNPSGMTHKIAERMISCQKEHRMYTESKQTHRVQQQGHSRLSRMEAEEEDSEDEAEEEASQEKEVLVKVVDRSLVIIVELSDTMLGIARTPLLLVITANPTIIP